MLDAPKSMPQPWIHRAALERFDPGIHPDIRLELCEGLEAYTVPPHAGDAAFMWHLPDDPVDALLDAGEADQPTLSILEHRNRKFIEDLAHPPPGFGADIRFIQFFRAAAMLNFPEFARQSVSAAYVLMELAFTRAAEYELRLAGRQGALYVADRAPFLPLPHRRLISTELSSYEVPRESRILHIDRTD